MRLRRGLSVSMTILFLAGCAWAQRRGLPAPPSWNPGLRAPGFGSGMKLQGQTLPLRSFAYSTPSYFRDNRSGFFSYPGRFHHRNPYSFGFGYSPFYYGGYAGFGYPYSYGPYYGAPYGSYYQAPYGCDTRFSSLPFNCVPLYPQGPPAYDSERPQADGYPSGNGWDRAQGYEAGQSAGGPQAAGKSVEGPAPISREDLRNNVQRTLDGNTLSSGHTLTITSGRHELVVSAAPAK
jgi:hypothetical protein